MEEIHFTWDDKKEKLNRRKHDISFNEAKEIFIDPLNISDLDKRFSDTEERWVSIGRTKKDKLLIVAHLWILYESGEEIIRIISARKVTTKEKELYEDFKGKIY